MDIPAIVESVLGRHESGDAFVLDDVMAADSAAREVAGREIEARVKVAR
jgi:1-deoxy-D-xylulose 5-phosphate reductoisomerase